MIKMTRESEKLLEMCRKNRIALANRLRAAADYMDEGKDEAARRALTLVDFERRALESNQQAFAASFFFGGTDA
jgi:hypothetical protein